MEIKDYLMRRMLLESSFIESLEITVERRNKLQSFGV